MGRFTTKRYEQILTQMTAKVVSRSDFTDISDSSTWKHVLAAAARQDDEQYYQMALLLQLFSIDKAAGEDLDERAKDISLGVIAREEAAKSSGYVVISRDATVGTVAIASGTRVMTAAGIVVVTTAAGSITPTSPVQIVGHSVGQDSGLIPAIAEEPGADGNVVAGTLVKFGAKPPGVDSVTNPSDFAYGLDEETDDAFRSRLRQYIATLARGTVMALENAVLGATHPDTGAVILFAKAVEDIVDRGHVTLYIDDGTGLASTTETVTSENVTEGLAGPPADSAVGGETYLFLDYKPVDSSASFVLTSSVLGVMVQGTDFYLNPASGQINFDVPLVPAETIDADYTRYTGLIELAQKIIDGDVNDRVNYPGYRGGGILVIVQTPQVLIQTVAVSLVISEGYDTAEVESAVTDAIREYINTLGISGDVIRSTIINKVMAVAGVYDVTVDTPSANVVVLDDQMARTTDANITVN